MFDSCKISENMFEDLIMSLGDFCHIVSALISTYHISVLVLITIYMSSPTDIQNALFIVVFSGKGEIVKSARSVYGTNPVE